MKTKTNKLKNGTSAELKRAVKLSRWLGGIFVLPFIIIEKLFWNQLKKSEIEVMVDELPMIVPILLWLFTLSLSISIGYRIYLCL